MLFNSYQFWVFLAVVLLLYRRMGHRSQNRMLLIASYVFYGFWDWRFLSLIITSTVVDYFAALGIERAASERRRCTLLIVSLAANLGLLGVFKYYDFFVEELVHLATLAGVPFSLRSLNVILPVGISFYTFQTLSYTIDVYRGVTGATRRFLDFALYVAFFPQLVAGPIERSHHLLPQVLHPRRVTWEDFRIGLHHVVLGLFKKVAIADNLAPIVNTVFAQPTIHVPGSECLVGIYAFAFQIYGDFSGYSSIAIGVARWMGFDIMTNFRAPYLARSPREFWRRWHISLSTWLRDYLYISLGGNRGNRLFTYRNLLLTMLLGGLWHGAAWTFVLWGAYHGALLVIHRFVEEVRGSRVSVTWLGAAVRILLTFHAVCVGWLLFRAENLAQVGQMLTALVSDFRVTPFAISAGALIAFFAGPLFLYEAWLQRAGESPERGASHWILRGLVYAYCALAIWYFPPPVSHEFIYFQF